MTVPSPDGMTNKELLMEMRTDLKDVKAKVDAVYEAHLLHLGAARPHPTVATRRELLAGLGGMLIVLGTVVSLVLSIAA